MKTDLVIFCAAWCGVCRDLNKTWLTQPSNLNMQMHWVDIDDHADQLENLEFESFPYIATFKNKKLSFFGTVLPNITVIEKIARQTQSIELDLQQKSALEDLLRLLTCPKDEKN